MRRFIDVVFVNPKGRYYVVLHQGKFWQVPRLSLTASSWIFKLAYKGSLNEIFVAKNQALACEHLDKVLHTYELPEQLSGMSASRFLDWWSMNDYKVLNQNDVVHLSPAAQDTPKNPNIINSQTATPKTSQQNQNAVQLIKKTSIRPATQIKPAAQWVLDRLAKIQKDTDSKPAKTTALQSNQKTSQAPINTQTPTNKKTNTQGNIAQTTNSPTLRTASAKSAQKVSDAQTVAQMTRDNIIKNLFTSQDSTQNSSTSQTAQTTNQKTDDKNTLADKANTKTSQTSDLASDGLDIFDDLLRELNQQVRHRSQ